MGNPETFESNNKKYNLNKDLAFITKKLVGHLPREMLVVWHWQLCVSQQVDSVQSSPAFLSGISHRF